MADLVIQHDTDKTLALATLAANTAILVASNIDESRENGFRIIKSRLGLSFRGKTASEGPALVGMAIGMSIAEIKAVLEDDPQKSIDPVSKGPGQWLKVIGTIDFLKTSGQIGRSDGLLTEVDVNWTVPEGSALVYFAYAEGVFSTTGTVLQIYAEHMGVWLRD